MPSVLLYAPDVDGHPRVYCRAIADALRDTGWPLVLALGFRDAGHLGRSADLQDLQGRPHVALRAVGTGGGGLAGRLTAEELSELQREVDASVTIFIEADKFAGEFQRIARGVAPRLHGRTLAIFAETAPWRPGEDAFTGEPLRRGVLPRLRSWVARAVRRRSGNTHPTPREFYEGMMLGQRVVDALLVKDERVVAAQGPPVVWMPEISRPLGVTTEPDPSARAWAARIKVFLSAQDGRRPVLYFGDDAYYKGYDLWLDFLRRNPDVCGIHAGRNDAGIESERCTLDASRLRRELVAQGRLLEYGGYVASQALKQVSFEAVPVYLTTHRLALSSSTVIQAAEFGVPVLVPDRGLLAHRVRTAGIGLTYRYGDLDDLARQARRMWAEPVGQRASALAAFYRKFDDEAIIAFWRALVGPLAA